MLRPARRNISPLRWQHRLSMAPARAVAWANPKMGAKEVRRWGKSASLEYELDFGLLYRTVRSGGWPKYMDLIAGSFSSRSWAKSLMLYPRYSRCSANSFISVRGSSTRISISAGSRSLYLALLNCIQMYLALRSVIVPRSGARQTRNRPLPALLGTLRPNTG